MKSVLVLLLTLALIFSAIACNGTTNTGDISEYLSDVTEDIEEVPSKQEDEETSSKTETSAEEEASKPISSGKQPSSSKKATSTESKTEKESSKPKASSSKPAASSNKTETSSGKPAASPSKTTTASSKPKVSSSKPATSSDKPVSTSQTVTTTSQAPQGEYTVTFSLGYGGKSFTKKSKNYKVAKPENPSREGYEFSGWFTETTGEQWSFAGHIVTEDMTLVARWSEIKYSVSSTDKFSDSLVTPSNTTSNTPSNTTSTLKYPHLLETLRAGKYREACFEDDGNSLIWKTLDIGNMKATLTFTFFSTNKDEYNEGAVVTGYDGTTYYEVGGGGGLEYEIIEGENYNEMVLIDENDKKAVKIKIDYINGLDVIESFDDNFAIGDCFTEIV